jgi:TonB-dependent starch-binding outer membrane protein SusC
MWRTAIASVVVALSAAAPVLAQTGTITGTVTIAEGGRPLADAQVRAGIGGTSATYTRVDGRYTLTVSPGTYTVRVTRLGFAADSLTNVVVTAGAATAANFTLKQTAAVLSQVVVTVPYAGEQSGREQTGAVASVTPREFNTGRIVSPQQLISGKVAGVQVVDNNEPGGGIAIRVRGGTSVNASNEPLYVIDGVPLQIGGGTSSGRNPLNFLNAQDIENITVLKDASATAIYGSRGANGVILVTTRSGSTGPQFSYSGTVSSSRVTGGPDMVNAAQYRAAVQQYAGLNVGILGSANTNWLGEVEQNGGGIQHDLTMNGRRADAAYHLGLDYLDQKGVLRGTETQRVAATVNYSDQLLSNRLTLRTHLKGARSRDYFTPGSVLGEAVALAPTQPIFSSGTQYFQWPSSLGTNNPIADLRQIQDHGNTFRSIGNVEGEYALPWINGLSATLRGSYDAIQADRTTFTPSYAQSQREAGTNPGNINRNQPKELSTVVDAFAHYVRPLDFLSSAVDVTGGYSRERFRGDYASVFAQGLSTDLLGLDGMPAANDIRPTYNVDESLLISAFGRVNYTINDKYLFTGTMRRDGSSKFAPGRQWGTFPSAAFAWRAGEEDFIRGKFNLSDLKVRVSWGLNGNQSVGNYNAYTSYTVGTTTAQAQFGNQFITTIRPSASDTSLHWEKTASADVGVDFGFFDNRLSGSIDYYSKKTTDLLFKVPTAAGTALSNEITTNIGSMSNKGFELSLNAIPIEGGRSGLTWNTNFIASTNKNRLLTIDRPGLPFILVGNIAGGVGSKIQVLKPGQAANSFFVYQHKMVNGKPVNSDVNGDGTVNEQDMYVDLNHDGIVNGSDLRAFHSPQPKWILAHTSMLSWRNFDASTTLRAYLGNYVYNNVASNLGNYSVLQLQNAPTNLHASALKNGFIRPQYLSDVYVESASFLRMDNLTLGYTFDRLAGLRGARVFGSVQSVFTNTKYSGVDPTAGLNGIDNNLYPRSRTFLTGLSVGF